MQVLDQFAEVDDFYNSADFDDFNAQLRLASSGKFAEVDAFYNSADFDGFTALLPGL